MKIEIEIPDDGHVITVCPNGHRVIAAASLKLGAAADDLYQLLITRVIGEMESSSSDLYRWAKRKLATEDEIPAAPDVDAVSRAGQRSKQKQVRHDRDAPGIKRTRDKCLAFIRRNLVVWAEETARGGWDEGPAVAMEIKECIDQRYPLDD